MIEQTTFLGLPLRTPRQRRLLVILYYAVVVGLGVFGLCKSKAPSGVFVWQTFVLGGLLGGLRPGGPVKPYSEPRAPMTNGLLDEAPISLDLNGRSTRAWGPFPWSPLDERELGQRDRAHFVAYRILIGGLMLASVGYCAGMLWSPAWLLRQSPMLLWLLIVVTLSLPQSVLLWTVPNEPAGELVALRPAAP